jgi:hypothetical protein
MSVRTWLQDQGATPAPIQVSKSSLSGARQRLVALMQSMNFGRIEALIVRAGEPVLDPLPRIIREVKFCGDNSPWHEPASPDFALKHQVINLFAHFDQIQNGTIAQLVIKHGLPFSMTLEATA